MDPYKYDNGIVYWRYERLSVLGGITFFPKKFEEMASFSGFGPQVEFGNVQRENGRDFLAIAATNQPYRDVTLTRGANGKGSVLIYSLDEKESENTLRQIIDSYNLTIDLVPEQGFIHRNIEMELERQAYVMGLEVAKKSGESIENVFAVVRYANFLNRYKSITSEVAFSKAARRFCK